ncbi:MAG: DUF4861 family protein [Bacteroidales bacterium]|nr:DUF4861 family protein [Bacteroidales bacterium]
MKTCSNSLFTLVILFILLTGCSKDKVYVISNSENEPVTDLAYVLNRSVVNRFLADSTTELKPGVRDESGTWLPSQCDDLDGDGRWDELAFLCSLKAGESKKVVFEIPDSMPEFPKRTNIRFGRMTKPFEEVVGDLRMKTNDTEFTTPVYQMEGPAWENDVIAFRNYYDARNGMDIFGKCTAEMVLDSVGVNGREYHMLADWGMDILKVGNSLGAGAIAIGIGDSLYRVGLCEEGSYRQISEGPVRAMLEFTYKNVPAANRLYNVTHRISIYAGEHFYRNDVWVDGLQGDEELVTGIVNLHDVAADTFDSGNMKVMYSLGKQGYSGEWLGMGILVYAEQFKGYREADTTGTGIVNTHLVSLALSSDQPTVYTFLAAWENRDEQVKDKDYFVDMLKKAVGRIAMTDTPVRR